MSRSFLVLLIAAFFAPGVSADSASDALDRMKARLPMIDEMKEAGKVGENAAGYLSPRVELPPRQASIVKAENSDRRTVYRSVANKTGQTVEEVGANRAVRIAEIAAKNVWLQRPDGSWYMKS